MFYWVEFLVEFERRLGVKKADLSKRNLTLITGHGKDK